MDNVIFAGQWLLFLLLALVFFYVLCTVGVSKF